MVAEYGKIQIEFSSNFVIGKDNCTPEFLAKNPLGKVPVLETPEGCIFETNAICRFLARIDPKTQLFGNDDFEKAQVDQWLDFTLSEIDLPTRVWIFAILGMLEVDAAGLAKAKADIRKVLGILNDHLEDRTFLVGERVTLADIVVAIHLLGLYTKALDGGFRKAFVNTNRWFVTCVNQPQWKAILGEVALCTKMAAPKLVHAAKSEHEHEKHEKHEKPPKKQQSEKKKKNEAGESEGAATPEPAKEKKKKKKDDEDDEDEEHADPKPRSLLDLLPKSSMDLDEWKRMYSNNDGKISMPWFWEHLDREGYSLWFADYKYPEDKETESLLWTCNFIGGWFQRLERFHKYGFGNAIIFKSENDPHHTISSCWLIRGKDMPAEMTECSDYDLYTWKRVENVDDSAIRKDIEEYWTWEGDFSGRKFVQGKTFK